MLHHINFRQKVIVMLAVMSGMFLVALDQTIMSTALTKIVEEFNSFSSLSWVITAYLLTSTISVPIAGKMSDIFGRRLALLVGVGIFTLASFLSGAAQSMDQLIWFRALQGIGGGIVMSNAFTIIGDLFNAKERGKWQGIIGGIFSLASVIGPVLGGFLTDGNTIFGLTTDWRWTLWINIPIGIVSLILIAVYCPSIKHDHKPKIDFLGAGLIGLALATLVLSVENTEHIFADVITATGLTSGAIQLILLGIAIISTIGFILAERRAAEPILPLSFFKKRNFNLMSLIALFSGAAFLGGILYLTQFNQQVFGAGATEAGLMILPMIAALTISSIASGLLVAKTGKYKPLLIAGLGIATIGIGALMTLTAESTYLQEALLMAMAGLGIGLTFPVINIVIQNEFEQKDLGAATSSSQLFRSLGSTLGTAILGAMLTTGVAAQLGEIKNDAYIQTLRQNPQSAQMVEKVDANTLLALNTAESRERIIIGVEQGLAQAQLPDAQKGIMKQQFVQQQTAFGDKVTGAFAETLRGIFFASAALMAAAIPLAFFVKQRPMRHMPDTPGVIE
ncbi:MAG TPA: MDR family MFS transporter [Verrucomicrobiae bacterium]|nr:MDR family MFS transporter [Verrucomicrobiae bacterium]